MATQATKKVRQVKTDAVKALAAEATNETHINLTFRGEDLVIDGEALDDYELMDQLTKGMPMVALTVFVPDDEQRARLIDGCEKNSRGAPKLSSVLEMTVGIMEALGAGK